MDCQLFNRFSIAVLAMAAVALHFDNAALGQETASALRGSSLSLGMIYAQGEEVVDRASRFSAVITLDDDKLDSLLRKGRIEVIIPSQLINNIDSVIIKRPIYFKEVAATGFADAELAGKSLEVAIDDSIIERIDYQPVELKVYEIGFSSVVLKYIGISGQRHDSRAIGDPKTDSPILTVKFKSGKVIAGRISGMLSLDIDSILGPISVSFAKTTKILVGQEGELNIEMMNGDLISGTIEGDKIELLNRWKNETIDLTNVAALIVQRPKSKAARQMQPPTAFSNTRYTAEKQMSQPVPTNVNDQFPIHHQQQ